MKKFNYDSVIKENNIKLEAIRLYCMYGWAIAEIVLNDIIKRIPISNKTTLNHYKSVRERIIKKQIN